MRISDWSSDVCSSDLERIVDRVARHIGAISGHRPPDQLGARDTLFGGERLEPLDIIVRNVREEAHRNSISYRDIKSMLPDRMGNRRDRKSVGMGQSV